MILTAKETTLAHEMLSTESQKVKEKNIGNRQVERNNETIANVRQRGNNGYEATSFNENETNRLNNPYGLNNNNISQRNNKFANNNSKIFQADY